MKFVTVVGARPQFIKAATVSRVVRGRSDIREVIVHTGQHYDANMSDVFFGELDIPRPDHHLGIGGGTHGAMTGRMLEAIERTLLDEMPDAVLVYGDTNSTLAGALAAAKLHIPVAHVEAGLRSFNRLMPEELNRICTDHLADLLFAPTTVARDHLRAEGRPESAIRMAGDVMYDAALFYGGLAEQRSTVLSALGLSPRGYVLATIHRAENTDDPARLRAIIEGFGVVAGTLPVVLPLHPRTRGVLARDAGLQAAAAALRIIDPVGYLDMVMLEKNAAVVATDSGGVQKEAFFHQAPCVTLRDETEWVELVEGGWNRLCPPAFPETVAKAVLQAVGTRGRTISPYGDGHAAEKIVADVVALRRTK